MDLYLDTADDAAWADLMPTGLFKGITTNPLLAVRAGLDYPTIDWSAKAMRARDLGAQELHAQVFGSVDGYVAWAGALYEAGAAAGLRTVVKIPMTEAGIRAVPAIKALGGPILMTALYHPKQVFVAKALNADFAAPYFGRMSEAGLPAVEMLDQMHEIARGRPRLLVASLRSADQLVALAQRGLDCFTLSPEVAQTLLGDSLTDAAAAAFEAAAAGQGS
ncbi:MAG: transaldolase family protein [Marivita sp.]|uniref:transaldolase family protein n=1 Tax=Marivita sp. TaxID=2003365 RepID=UPI003EF08F8B